MFARHFLVGDIVDGIAGAVFSASSRRGLTSHDGEAVGNIFGLFALGVHDVSGKNASAVETKRKLCSEQECWRGDVG